MAGEARRAEAAQWVSYLLSAQTGSVVTPEQLLGTEDQAKAAKEVEAEERIAALQERMKKAGHANG